MRRITTPGWQARERDVTPEDMYLNRRRFLKTLGLGSISAAATLAGCGHNEVFLTQSGGSCNPETESPSTNLTPLENVYPVTRYAVDPERALTPHLTAISFNNFYEFTQHRQGVWCLAQVFTVDPWSIEIAGLSNNPRTVDLEDVLGIAALEERIYRFRCVEAWAMTVPWVGIPLADFIQWCEPKSEATHVRFVSAYDPDEMPNRAYIWPYYDALRMDEALNEVAFLAVGLYGKVLPGQNGAPLRLILPWKYGYKSIKSVVRVEFTDHQPPMFWNDIDPVAYGFLSNVDPDTPHPQWSQATEMLLGTRDSVPTLKFNGYGEWVAGLYA